MCIDYNTEPMKIQCLICNEKFEIENNYIGIIFCPKCGAWTEDLISWFNFNNNYLTTPDILC